MNTYFSCCNDAHPLLLLKLNQICQLLFKHDLKTIQIDTLQTYIIL